MGGYRIPVRGEPGFVKAPVKTERPGVLVGCVTVGVTPGDGEHTTIHGGRIKGFMTNEGKIGGKFSTPFPNAEPVVGARRPRL